MIQKLDQEFFEVLIYFIILEDAKLEFCKF